MQEAGQLDYKKIAEAALFASGRAMSVEELAAAIGVGSVGSLEGIMEALINDYKARDSALEVQKLGSKYVMGIREPYATKVNGLAGSPDISKGALRILSYISKNEPVMQNAVVKAFGTTTYDYMKELAEKEFVSAKKIGRTKRIETTEKFREYFNVQGTQ